MCTRQEERRETSNLNGGHIGLALALHTNIHSYFMIQSRPFLKEGLEGRDQTVGSSFIGGIHLTPSQSTVCVDDDVGVCR